MSKMECSLGQNGQKLECAAALLQLCRPPQFGAHTLSEREVSLYALWGNKCISAPIDVLPLFSAVKLWGTCKKALGNLTNYKIHARCLKIIANVSFNIATWELYLQPKNRQFLKNYSLRANSVTSQITFKRTKNGGKCPNWKVQMQYF